MDLDAVGPDFYENADLVDAYLAHRHRSVTSPNLVMEEPAVVASVGDLRGRRVLDLGCGDGTFAVACADGGCAGYLGIDGSRHMIERATGRGLDDRIGFVHADISTVQLPTSAFELVTARMALHYVADIARVLTGVRQALVPGGRLVMSVIHPVVTATMTGPEEGLRESQVVDGYFIPGARTRRWFGADVAWHHRTIEDYVSAVAASGFSLDRFSECSPVESLFDGDRDEFERRRQVPLFLVLGATRSATYDDRGASPR